MIINIYADDVYIYNHGKKMFLIPLVQTTRDVSNNQVHFFLVKNRNTTIGIDSKVIVKFKQEVDINDILKQYTVFKQLSKSTFVLKAKDTTQAISIANQLTQSGQVVYAQPNIYRKPLLR